MTSDNTITPNPQNNFLHSSTVGQNDVNPNDVNPNFINSLLENNAFANDTMQEQPPALTQRVEQTLDDVEQTHQLAAEYCQKYPELVPFQDAIINEAMAALLESHINDPNIIDDRQALDRGINRFKQKLGAYQQQQTQLITQQQLHQKMLKLDTGISIPNSQPHSISQALNVIGDNDRAFSQYRQHFLNKKGM